MVIKMAFEDLIKIALEESISGLRKGDKKEEVKAIQNYLKNAKKIFVPNKNNTKVKVINEVLRNFGLNEAEHFYMNTNTADFNRIPAISKAIYALDQLEADLIIARGRLGLPGSGSLLVFIDDKGRILTAGSSPSHIIHQKSLEEAVIDETTQALKRIGLNENTNSV